MTLNNRAFAQSIYLMLSPGLALVIALSSVALAQMGAGADSELQQKLAALKQVAAANKQKLRHYQWIETTQTTLKGEQKPEKVYQCLYGPDGREQRIPLGAQQQEQQQSSGGRRGGALRQRVVEKKTEEIKDYMQQVQSLLSLYVPPNSQLMQQAFQKKNVSLDKSMGSDGVQIAFSNYAKQGDLMTIGFDPAAKKISSIHVNTYMDDPKDAVTLAIRMASLPDGTNYAEQKVVNATAKQLQVATTSSNFAKLR